MSYLIDVSLRRLTPAFASLALVTTLLLTAPNEPAVTVLDRAKLGNYIYELTSVKNGPFANHIAMVVGYEVWGLPPTSQSDATLKKLFDLRQLGITQPPNGIAYVESEHLFAFVEPNQPFALFLSDNRGRPQATRAIQYLNGYVPEQIEGLTYIPPTAPMFPDHLVSLTGVFTPIGFEFRLEVIRRDGQVVAEIPIQLPIPDNTYISGVEFLPPDRFVVAEQNSLTLWTLDFGGNTLAGPIDFPEAAFVEGFARLRDGRIVATSGSQLYFFDENLNRLPTDDRTAHTGVGLASPVGLAWNTDTNEYLVRASTESGSDPLPHQIVALPPSLDSARLVVDLNTFGPLFIFRSRDMSYLPDEHLMALAHTRAPRGIALLDNSGALVETVALTPLGTPNHLSYIPPTREFAVTFGIPSSTLKIVARTGAFVRDIDLAPLGITAIWSFTFFNPDHPTGGQFLVFGIGPNGLGDYRAVITDFNGTLIDSFDYREALGVLQPVGLAAITTGTQAGAFSVVDQGSSELVVFRLGCRRQTDGARGSPLPQCDESD